MGTKRGQHLGQLAELRASEVILHILKTKCSAKPFPIWLLQGCRSYGRAMSSKLVLCIPQLRWPRHGFKGRYFASPGSPVVLWVHPWALQWSFGSRETPWMSDLSGLGRRVDPFHFIIPTISIISKIIPTLWNIVCTPAGAPVDIGNC